MALSKIAWTRKGVIVIVICVIAVSYLILTAIAFYGRVYICPSPLHRVSEGEILRNVAEYVRSRSDFPDEIRDIDPKNCCEVVNERSSPEDAVRFKTVLLNKWVDIVRVTYGNDPKKQLYFRINQCGRVVAGDQ